MKHRAALGALASKRHDLTVILIAIVVAYFGLVVAFTAIFVVSSHAVKRDRQALIDRCLASRPRLINFRTFMLAVSQNEGIRPIPVIVPTVEECKHP